MSEIKCFNCGHEYDHKNTIFCPNCKKPKNPNIPNYPRFKGPGIMMFFWGFFRLPLFWVDAFLLCSVKALSV